VKGLSLQQENSKARTLCKERKECGTRKCNSESQKNSKAKLHPIGVSRMPWPPPCENSQMETEKRKPRSNKPQRYVAAVVSSGLVMRQVRRIGMISGPRRKGQPPAESKTDTQFRPSRRSKSLRGLLRFLCTKSSTTAKNHPSPSHQRLTKTVVGAVLAEMLEC
jgi:hypothetical protein